MDSNKLELLKEYLRCLNNTKIRDLVHCYFKFDTFDNSFCPLGFSMDLTGSVIYAFPVIDKVPRWSHKAAMQYECPVIGSYSGVFGFRMSSNHRMRYELTCLPTIIRIAKIVKSP